MILSRAGRKVTVLVWVNIKCHGVMAVGDYGHRISEQGMVLGISGGLNYAVGSMLPFFIFISACTDTSERKCPNVLYS